MTKTRLKITDMHCTACAMNIDFELEDLPGVKSSTTNYAKSECFVEYDESKTSLNQITRCINTVGYRAFPVKS